ncbi:MAG: peroxiredoxin family protein [Fidelibacterota bacterium]
MKKIQYLTILLLFIALMGCEAQGNTPAGKSQSTQQAKEMQQKTGKIMAPDFTLADVNGEWVSLSDFKGKVVLLNFWGTWCAPCRREIPDFIKLYDKYNGDGLEIVGITLSSGSAEDIARFMADWNMNYTILTDIKGNETQIVTQNYGQATGRPINGIPTTFIINRQGEIVKAYVGPRTEEIFYNDLKPYL